MPPEKGGKTPKELCSPHQGAGRVDQKRQSSDRLPDTAL